jgi:hypothetical protein
MSAEYLNQRLQETSDNLEELSSTEKSLTEKEKKYRGQLLRRQHILTLIEEARKYNRKDAELFHNSVYSLLVPWGENHPVLMFFMLIVMRMKWSSGSFIRFR